MHSVPSRKVHVHNHQAWEVARDKLVKTIAYKLGLGPDYLSVELEMLLLMEKGSRINHCLIDNGGVKFVGMLFIQLPSVFTGGKVGIFDLGNKCSCGHEHKTMSNHFNLGITSGKSAYSCYFICHYSDCELKIAKIQSGSCVLLQYSLHYKIEPKPTSNSLNSSMIREIICLC